ncbi:MAG: protein kinase [Candidatus Hydrogenedentes bacterium]|nr:protein kinase [Candidatus Hydrogenedentota bacterium]
MDAKREILFCLFAVDEGAVSAEAVIDAASQCEGIADASISDLLVELGRISPHRREAIFNRVDRSLTPSEAEDATVPGLMHFAQGPPDEQHPDESTIAVWSLNVYPDAELRDAIHEAGISQREAHGRYTGQSEHARGGMGRILIARDSILAREVIIKELRRRHAGQGGAPFHVSQLRRFLQEAQITASLEHPSIIPLYELGLRQDGTPYYTMKVVRGKTLAQAIREAKTLPDRMRLLPNFLSVCQAVAYAHSRGVIHRDLKPANVIIGEFGETVVLDWGLAKRRDADDAHQEALEKHLEMQVQGTDSGGGIHTTPGALMGTPMYMAPEQAAGKFEQVGEWTDVYALGVILYEILGGRSPFTWTTLAEVIQKVRRGEFPRLELVASEVPRDLAAVCARSMSTRPEDRYPSALELAKEVDRFLSGAVVEAYNYQFTEHLKRFMRRHYKAIGAAVLALVTLVTLGTWSYLLVKAQRDVAQQAQGEADAARVQAQTAQGRAEVARQDATRALYGAYIALASNHVAQGHYDQARAILQECPPVFRNWEWGRLEFLCNRDYQSFRHSLDWNLTAARGGNTWSPANYLVMLEQPQAAFDLVNGLTREVLDGRPRAGTDSQYCISPDGRWLMRRTGNDGILMRREDSTEALTFALNNHWVWSFEFSNDGSALAARSAPDQVTVWDLNTMTARCTVDVVGLGRCSMSHNSRYLATYAAMESDAPISPGQLLLYETASGSLLYSTETPAQCMAFAPATDLLYTGGVDGSVAAWSPQQSTPLWTEQRTAGPVLTLAFGQLRGPDGAAESVIAGTEGGQVYVIELATGRERGRWRADTGPVSAIAASPDGRELAIGAGPAVHLLASDCSGVRDTLEGHSDPLVRLDYSPDGQFLYSMCRKEVKIWNLNAPGPTVRLAEPGALSGVIAGDELVTADREGRHTHWDPAKGTILHTDSCAGVVADEALLSPDGHRLLAKANDGLHLWDLENGKCLASFADKNYELDTAVFSSSGSWLALLDRQVYSGMLSVDLVDAAKGDVARSIHLYTSENTYRTMAGAAAFSPDERAVTVTFDGRLNTYRLDSGVQVASAELPVQDDRVTTRIAYHPAGARVALALAGNQVALAQITGELTVYSLGMHTQPVTALAFNATGDRLFSGDAGGYVILWDVDAGQQLLGMSLLHHPVRFLAWSETAQAVVAGDGSETVLVHAFPWREEDLPGGLAWPLPERLAALKTYHPLLAPPWGQCQRAMQALQDEWLKAVSSGPPTAPRDEAASACPSGGVLSIAKDGPQVSCSLHGPLRNSAHLVAQVRAYEETRGVNKAQHAALRAELWDALPDSLTGLSGLADRWLYQEKHSFATAAVACEKGLAIKPSSMEMKIRSCAAALAMGDIEHAANLASEIKGTHRLVRPILSDLVTALGKRGSAEDIEKACELLCDHLKYYPADKDLHRAVGDLLKSPHWSTAKQSAAVERLLEYDPESWRTLPWHGTIAQAQAQAAVSGKPVLLLVAVDDEDAMRRMNVEIFSNPLLQDEIVESFELARVVADKTPAVREMYGLLGLPAIVFLDKDGVVLNRAFSDWTIDDFRRNITRPARNQSVLREWHIAGPFTLDQAPSIESTPTMAAGLDLDARYEGSTGTVDWAYYRQPGVCLAVNLSQLYPNLNNSVFYAYTCFELAEPLQRKLSLTFTDRGQAWLDGEPIGPPGVTLRGTIGPIPVDLTAGRHEILVKLTSRWTAGVTAELNGAKPDEAIPGLSYCALPARRILAYRVHQLEQDDGTKPQWQNDENNTHATVDKRQAMLEWRANYATILATLNPRPYMEDGKIVGIKMDNVEQVPSIAQLGFRNGDMLVAVNGYRLGEGKSVLEIAELTDGSSTYEVEILRAGKPHYFHIHTEKN